MKQTRKSRTSTQNLNNFPHATKTLGSMLQKRSQSICRLENILSPRSLARCSPDRQRPATHPRTCPLDQARATKTSMVMIPPLKMTLSREDLEDNEIKNKTPAPKQRQFVPNIHGTRDTLKKGGLVVIDQRPERDLLDSERPDKFVLRIAKQSPDQMRAAHYFATFSKSPLVALSLESECTQNFSSFFQFVHTTSLILQRDIRRRHRPSVHTVPCRFLPHSVWLEFQNSDLGDDREKNMTSTRRAAFGASC